MLNKCISKIEKIGNKLPHPIYIFIYLFTIIAILSFFTKDIVIYNKFTDKYIYTKTLLSKDGILWFTKNIIKNFIEFPALGMVIVTMLGMGLAEESGLVTSIIKIFLRRNFNKYISFVIIFIGVMGSIAGSSVFAIIPPLGGLIFFSLKKHPIGGILGGFAGVAGGLSANLLITPTDIINTAITQKATNSILENYTIAPTANWYFMFTSTFLLALIGWFIIDKILEPYLFKAYPIDFNSDISLELIPLNNIEKKALKYSLLSIVIYLIFICLIVFPNNSIFRNSNGGLLPSPFFDSLIFFITLLFFIPGYIYGKIVGKIKNKNDFVKILIKSISNLSEFILICFFAAQLTSLFNYTNISLLISNIGSELLINLNINIILIIILFILLSSILNIFIGILSAKWMIIAPIFIPLFVNLGISPEFTQAAFRIADSVTNPISPLEVFMPYIIICCHKYNKNIGLGSIISLMLPFSILFLIGWVTLLLSWYLLNLPLGPNAYIFL